MRTPLLGIVFLLALRPGGSAGEPATLREMFERAGPREGYDRWIELETGVVYAGGLLIGPIFFPYSDTPVGEPGQDVRIVGNGAILDLRGAPICLSYCNNRLDIDDCIIINGGIFFRGYRSESVELCPAGSVRQVTFWRPRDYGVRLRVENPDIAVERNLIVDAVDTGPDFLYLTGIPSEWLPTGTSVGSSLGAPGIRENWSFHSDSAANADPLSHFAFLCPYG
jgi:hypothetical protein